MMYKYKTVLVVGCLLMLSFFSSTLWAGKEPGLVLHYDFNEGSGLLAKDKSGNGLDGKIVGAKYVRKDKGYALEFDGKSCVQVAESSILNKLGKPGMSYTIEFRFKSSGGLCPSFTEKWPDGSSSYPWAIRGPYPDGKVDFAVYDVKTNKGIYARYKHPATKDNKWRHLAAVRDMKSGHLLLYIDGVLGKKTRDTLAKVDMSNNGPVCLGARRYTTQASYGIVGQLDDVRIYDRACSADEIKSRVGAATTTAHWDIPSCGYSPDSEKLPVHRDIESAGIVEKYKPVTPAVSLSAGEMTVKAGARGAVQIDAGSDSYIVESCFSYPGADNKIGWNGFPRAFNQPCFPRVKFQKGAESAWQPIVKRISADTISVDAKGKYYRIQRTIKVRDGKVDFEDRVTNLGTAPVGVIVRYGITANKDFLERYNPGLEVAANPAVFLEGPKRSAAMVMNDNLSRRFKAALGSALNHSGVQIYRFALAAGKTYTFSWSVYITKEGRGSYFDVINRIRKDWNANFTIDGFYNFAYLVPTGDDIRFYIQDSSKRFYLNQVAKDPSKLQKYLKWRGIKMLSMAPWLYHDPGHMDHSPTRDEYIEIMKRFVPLMHKVAPQVKILASIETSWVGFRRENIKDSHRVPIADESDKRSLKVKLEPDVSKLVEDSRPGWEDSLVYDPQRRLEIYTYWRAGKPQETPSVHVFPEVGNSMYANLMDHIKLCIDELGFDGVYFDMFPAGQMGSTRTYNGKWDGLSAKVDFHTGRISGQYKDCSLAGAQARVNLMNYVLSKNKIFVANGHSTTLAEQSIPAFRFSETQQGIGRAGKKWRVGTKPPAVNGAFFSHLNTPLGLGARGGPGGDSAVQWLMKVTIIYLRHGMVFYFYNMTEPPMTEENKGAFDIAKHLFPITPVELGEGFIIGKERILTAISMDRLWEKDNKPTVLLFDINGHRVDTTDRCVIKRDNGKWRIILKLKDWAEVAVVE